MVDRATFPSDTVSTHFIHAPGMAALERWGLRDALAGIGLSLRSTRTASTSARSRSPVRPDPSTASTRPTARAGPCSTRCWCEQRPTLASRSSRGSRSTRSSSRTAPSSAFVARTPRGAAVTERATVVIGADGRSSSVAKAVQPEQYNEKPAVGPAFYSYWSGVGSSGFEVYVRDGCGMAAFPTHDDLTLVIVGTSEEAHQAARSDVEGAFLRTLDQAPALGDRVRAGNREERFHAASDLAGYFRKPYGPGWALVGDAGYHLHPITAQGITDAFLDAERLTEALDTVLRRERTPTTTPWPPTSRLATSTSRRCTR